MIKLKTLQGIPGRLLIDTLGFSRSNVFDHLLKEHH